MSEVLFYLKSSYRTFPGHGQEVCGLVWSNDGHYLASGGGDNLVKIWEPSMLTTEDPVRFSVVLIFAILSSFNNLLN